MFVEKRVTWKATNEIFSDIYTMPVSPVHYGTPQQCRERKEIL